MIKIGLFEVCLITLVSFFVILMVEKAIEGNEKSKQCELKGGVPQYSDRGMYRACAKPDNFINIGESK